MKANFNKEKESQKMKKIKALKNFHREDDQHLKALIIDIKFSYSSNKLMKKYKLNTIFNKQSFLPLYYCF